MTKPASLFAFTMMLAACSPANPQPMQPMPTTTTSDDAATTTSDAAIGEHASSPTDCPKSFAAAEKISGCTYGESKTCTYGASACDCEQFPQCGGVYRRPTQIHEPGWWRCSSTDPKQIDPTGCPYVLPRNGASCPTPGQECHYGLCGWNGERASCAGGRWVVEEIRLPPPP
ncbi:MAG: hypothetical protein ACHREM_12015 [Polyangiales bacterium]